MPDLPQGHRWHGFPFHALGFQLNLRCTMHGPEQIKWVIGELGMLLHGEA